MFKRLSLISAAVAMLLVLSAGVALAGKPVSDHDGDADSDVATSHTEDTDTNDGGTPNNVADEGDNAHPSGKDRSVEHGKSGNQGKSESNPDDSKGPMRFEGAQGDDKPNGPGGTDLADQDGNNGCGNDDDFNDDNNGWCGKHPTSGGGETGGSIQGSTEVLGESLQSGGSSSGVQVLGEQFVAGGATVGGVQVLGVKLVAGQALPTTGAIWMPMLILAMALLGVGVLMVRMAKVHAR